eukprot:1918881-Rhodomonas_salina.6
MNRAERLRCECVAVGAQASIAVASKLHKTILGFQRTESWGLSSQVTEPDDESGAVRSGVRSLSEYTRCGRGCNFGAADCVERSTPSQKPANAI